MPITPRHSDYKGYGPHYSMEIESRSLELTDYTDEQIRRMFLIPKDGKEYASCWNGHNFETLEVKRFVIRRATRNAYVAIDILFDDISEYQMQIFWPVDSRMTLKDISGARYYEQNADGSGWIFKHTLEGTHHDYELTALAACDGVFQPVFRQYQADSYSAKVDTQRETARQRYVLMAEFYGEVVAAMRTGLRATYLGEREQEAHPAEGWIDRDITAAVSAVRSKWTADGRSADLTSLSGGLTYINTALTMPSVETRWDREKRLADEAKKKAEAEATPPAESEGS